MDSTRYSDLFEGRVDVLQVVRFVDCIVSANVLLVYQHRRRAAFLHVIVTPDTQRCAALARKWSHLRCCSDARVLLSNITLDGIAKVLASVGPQAAAKGAPWYFQQVVKLRAVAHGVEGLGPHVRIMDGETLMVQPTDWFTGSGAEIFDTCDPKGRNHRQIGDGWNHERYGALYYKLTRLPPAGSPWLVAHGMSMTRQHARSLLDAFSPPGETWRSDHWVAHSLSQLCDAAAETGFSEYYYYSSWVLGQNKSAARVRVARDTCTRARDTIRATCTDGSSSDDSRIANWTTQRFGRHLYIVLENHASRAKFPPLFREAATGGGGARPSG